MPGLAGTGVLATAVAESANEKIGACAATYAAQASCPTYCPFFNGGGCYAENGRMFTGTTGPLNENARRAGATPEDVARAEAIAIDRLPVLKCWDRPLRLHSVGDCATDEAARIVAAAAARYRERGGGPVWTYTHAWRIVERESWGAVSVFASCETAEQAALARARGYAPSIVVEEFPGRRRYQLGTGLEVLPCPAQTSGATCASCRLCLDDSRIMDRGYAIGFAVHGTGFTVKQALKTLRAPGDESRRRTSRDWISEFYSESGRWPRPVEVVRGAGVSWASAKEMLARLRAEVAA